ncbi:CRPV-050 [Crowpox virus]|nr:CRPV-050 [Crowpox virus]
MLTNIMCFLYNRNYILCFCHIVSFQHVILLRSLLSR